MVQETKAGMELLEISCLKVHEQNPQLTTGFLKHSCCVVCVLAVTGMSRHCISYCSRALLGGEAVGSDCVVGVLGHLKPQGIWSTALSSRGRRWLRGLWDMKALSTWRCPRLPWSRQGSVLTTPIPRSTPCQTCVCR